MCEFDNQSGIQFDWALIRSHEFLSHQYSCSVVFLTIWALIMRDHEMSNTQMQFVATAAQ